jgi:tetratricopeptide (TPR) repeat protein
MAEPISIDRATSLERSGKWEEALIAYKQLRESASSEAVAMQARLGTARCLVALRKHPAALAELSPLPKAPTNEDDHRRLALAAEAMLHLGVWLHAESLAEVALSDCSDTDTCGAWIAVCSANLAKAYLHNDKPAQAARMYRSASGRFQQTGRANAAAECLALAIEIEKLLPDGESGPAEDDGPRSQSQ